MWISKKPYWITEKGVKQAEDLYKATYMGPWCLKTINQGWAETPCDIFYVENPDTAKGHSHYLGLFYRDNNLYVTRGDSAFSEPIIGLLMSDGEVIVSRYRHDMYMHSSGTFVDGGRDYFRAGGNINAPHIKVIVDKGDFKFEKLHE